MPEVKIGFINTLYHPYQVGGAERSVRFVAEMLVRQGHEVFVISCGEQPGFDEVEGVRVYREPLANLYWPYGKNNGAAWKKPLWHAIDTFNPVMAARVRRILLRERPNVVNTNNLGGFSVAVWPVIKALGIPLVHTIRDYYLLCIRSTLFDPGQGTNCDALCGTCKTLSAPRQKCTSRVDHVIAISQAVLDEHRSRGVFSDVPSAVIPNIANLSAPPESQMREPPYRRFGFLGRLDSSKGLPEMLQAFASARRECGDIRLVIGGVGNPVFISDLHVQQPLDGVAMLGRVDPTSFFSDIDYLIVPSRWKEPLGRVVLEAYFHGVPVLGARRGGIAESMVEGVTGFGFDADDPAHLAALISRCAAMSREDYRALHLGVRSQCGRFSATSITERYQEQFNRVAAEPA